MILCNSTLPMTILILYKVYDQHLPTIMGILGLKEKMEFLRFSAKEQ